MKKLLLFLCAVASCYGQLGGAITQGGAALGTVQPAFFTSLGQTEVTTSTGANTTATANTIYVEPFLLTSTQTVARITCNVNTLFAASHFSTAIYSVDRTTKLVDTGALSGATGGNVSVNITAVTLSPGWYYQAFTQDVIGTSMNPIAMLNSGNFASMFSSGTSGATVPQGTMTATSTAGALPSSVTGNITGATPVIAACVFSSF